MDESKKCFFCEAQSARFKFETQSRLDQTFFVFRCAQCGCLFLNPQPTAEELNLAYKDDYYGEGESKFAGPIEHLVQWFREARARRVARLLKPSQHILDVGCGNGRFLAQLIRQGFKADGIELEGNSAKRAAQVKGLNLHIGAFDEVDFKGQQFDAICLWHVFEHLPQPQRTLDKIESLLKTGGYLFLSLPNAASWQAMMAGPLWFHLDPPRHLFIPTAKGLLSELDRRGFVLKNIRHFSFEQNPFGFIQSWMNRFTQPREVLYEQLKGHGKHSVSGHKLAGAALATPALVLSILESLMRRGATIELVAHKK